MLLLRALRLSLAAEAGGSRESQGAEWLSENTAAGGGGGEPHPPLRPSGSFPTGLQQEVQGQQQQQLPAPGLCSTSMRWLLPPISALGSPPGSSSRRPTHRLPGRMCSGSACTPSINHDPRHAESGKRICYSLFHSKSGPGMLCNEACQRFWLRLSS